MDSNVETEALAQVRGDFSTSVGSVLTQVLPSEADHAHSSAATLSTSLVDPIVDQAQTVAREQVLPVGAYEMLTNAESALERGIGPGTRTLPNVWEIGRRVMLSIIMPVFNEAETIERAIEQVLGVELPCASELIVVDDGSTDGTASVLAGIQDPRVRVERHVRNQGKGAAILTGIGLAHGTHVVPFDADLEYTPTDLRLILEPVMAGRAEIVYGSRLFGANTVYQSFRYAMGNKMTTLTANILFDAYISDLHTCLKLVPVRLLRDLNLREKRFGLDTEITAQVLKRGYRPFEVPISYHSRTHAQGKKLDWRDGVACLWILFRVRAERLGRRHAVHHVAEGPGGTLDGRASSSTTDDVAREERDEAGPRIVLVGPSKRFLSGIAYYTYGLARALRSECRLGVLLIRRLMPARLYPGGARVGHGLSEISIPREVATFDGLDYFWGPSALDAVKFLRRERPDVIVLQWWTGVVLHSYLLLAAVGRRLGARIVVEFHESLDPAEQTYPLLSWYVRRVAPQLLDRCSAYVVHSESDRELLTAQYRLDPARVTVIPHAVYEHQLTSEVVAREPRTVCNLLFFGLIRPVKGLDDLIAAFEQLDDDEAEEYRLTIVGETWENCESIVESARTARHHERISIVNRYVTDSEADSHFRAADVVVLPYRSSSQSGVLHLAMGYGLPVVATNVGGLAEAAASYDGAELVEANSPSALLEGIRRARKLSPGSFNYGHRWSDTADAYRALFSRVLKDRTQSTSPDPSILLALDGLSEQIHEANALTR